MTIAVVGLGYVGIQLATAFGATRRTIGFDLDEALIAHYRRHHDPTGEMDSARLARAEHLEYVTDASALAEADVFIVAVPTPIDHVRRPDFGPLVAASRAVGGRMRRGAIVVYESTVYPGATEEVCVPVLEQCSGLEWQRDFHVGYSPERINPGDAAHRLETIVKVVAADDAATLEAVAALYESVVPAGIYRASSIRVAEAAKVIENTQRDLNIALINELAIIFDRIGLDTQEVLEAAATKWNFLRFAPGLVGGHCIGVDPYYLTFKAEMLGYHPEVILAGRRINDGMGKFVAEKTVKMLRSGAVGGSADVIVLGITFKENCRDLRNSQAVALIRELEAFGVRTHVHDPAADAAEARAEYGVSLLDWEALPVADALVLAVAHDVYLNMGTAQILAKITPGGCLMDVKGALPRDAFSDAAVRLWRL